MAGKVLFTKTEVRSQHGWHDESKNTADIACVENRATGIAACCDEAAAWFFIPKAGWISKWDY
jgi:hypothetical protein